MVDSLGPDFIATPYPYTINQDGISLHMIWG